MTLLGPLSSGFCAHTRPWTEPGVGHVPSDGAGLSSVGGLPPLNARGSAENVRGDGCDNATCRSQQTTYSCNVNKGLPKSLSHSMLRPLLFCTRWRGENCCPLQRSVSVRCRAVVFIPHTPSLVVVCELHAYRCRVAYCPSDLPALLT